MRRPILLACGLLLLGSTPLWSAGSESGPFLNERGAQDSAARFETPEECRRFIEKGHAAYFRGEYAKAVAAYESALRVSSSAVTAWLNGGAVWDEAGNPKEAARWYESAARIDSFDDEILAALGWAQLRSGRAEAAAGNFRRVLKRAPDHPSALLGLARAELACAHPQQTVALLTRAAGTSPFVTFTGFFLGRAYELLADRADAVAAYRRSVGSDSFFLEGRQALGRLYLRLRDFKEANRQFVRLHDADPRNAEVGAVLAKLQPLLTRSESPQRPEGLYQALPSVAASPAFPPGIPVLRVGVGTSPMGHPRARESLAFSASSDFTLSDARSAAVFASDEAGSFWTVRVKKLKKSLALELNSPRGRIIRRRPFIVSPKSRDRGLVALNLSGSTQGPALAAEKLLRGKTEISLRGRTISVVNILDLENYTHGVVSAEMPVRSPVEALKAQAVVARTHALFIKTVTKRHRKDGYDVCDEQHCQVYGGVRAESERSRAVVEATRGVIVTYHGKPAHVIYSSNCGGRTQNGRDVTGWGDVPYWKSVGDSPSAQAPPDSPWALRRWLESLPTAYCRPSTFVHPSLFRWSRIIPWAELSRKVDRRLRTGRLRRIRVLRRSPSGNVNALLVEGSRRKVKVDSELAIRGLLGMGSLRSTLFLPTVEQGPDGKPEALILQGGGWGHAVGLCQSGAMGRAEAGQDFEKIVLSYFPGTAIEKSNYAAEPRNP